MQGRLREMADGPWRVGDTLDILLSGAEPDGDVDWTAALTSIGLPGARVRHIEGSLRPTGAQRGGPVSEAVNLEAALKDAAARSADCLILDSSVAFAPADVGALRRLADTDPMIAGLSPRFDRDALCAFPDRERLSDGGPPREGAARDILTQFFPALSYVPLPDGRCLYLKGSVLAQFPPQIEAGGVDWDAYAARLNRYGFRMAMANHVEARVRPAERSREESLGPRIERLERLAPGMRHVMASFLSDPAREAERLFAALVPNRQGGRDIGFDFTHVTAHHSGTAQLARALVRGAVASWGPEWRVFVVAHQAPYDFHFAGHPDAPARVDPLDPRIFAAFIRIGQPFGWKDVDRAVRRAPALVFFMLDTIGLDCLSQAPDELEALWRFTLAEADAVLFNSAFTQRQFQRRFQVRPDLPQCVSLHSMRVDEYGSGPASPGEGGSILIVGNGFPHKYLRETAQLLVGAYPAQRIVALGLEEHAVPGVAGLPSGALDDKALSALYAEARLVVYPTLYEGFGFPVLEALAHRRPVLVRALAPFQEILPGLPQRANVHLFETDAELVRLVGGRIAWSDQESGVPARGWAEATEDLRLSVEAAISNLRYDRVVHRLDFMRGRLEWARRKPFRETDLSHQGGEAFGNDLDRAAGMAGRLAQGMVHTLGPLPGVRQLLNLGFGLLRRRSGP